ncbi:MAG: TonB-dependent receptor [Thermoanaerobaculia bacterium]|nr:TonB-dependent receptor [Thermoanaerobaculia bacterium]
MPIPASGSISMGFFSPVRKVRCSIFSISSGSKCCAGLKAPFWKNTTGGAIQLITKRPTAQLGGAVRATVGDLDRRDAAFRLNGALASRLYASLSASSLNRHGYARSLTNGRTMNDDNRDSARAALRWLATDSLIVDFSLDAQRERRSALDQPLVAIFPSDLLSLYNTVLADQGLVPVTDAFITGDLRTSYSDFPSRSDGDQLGGTLTVSRTFRQYGVTSISAYRDYDFSGSSDYDGTPNRVFDRDYRQRQKQWSQELQVSGQAFDGRLNWVAGGLYFVEEPRDEARVTLIGELFDALEAAPGPIYAPPGAPSFFCNPGPPPPGVPCFGGAGNPLNLAFFVGDGQREALAIKTKSASVFGEATLAIGKRLSATAGLRYTSEEKSFTFFKDPRNAPIQNLFNSDDWSAFSPRMSLAYQASDSVMVYSSISRGFKSGGFNGRVVNRDQLDPFDPETVWSFETGTKTELFDHRLQLNAAAFYNDYRDIQFSAAVLSGGVPTFIVQNAGTATVKGIELEVEARPLTGLTLTTGIGYLDSRYTDIEAEGGAPEGGRLPKAPKWDLSFAVQYAFELHKAGAMIVRGDYSYRSAFFNDITNSPLIEEDGYGLVNARVTWSPPSDRWELALFGTNLGDESYLEHGAISPAVGLATGISGRPREWGLNVGLRF